MQNYGNIISIYRILSGLSFGIFMLIIVPQPLYAVCNLHEAAANGDMLKVKECISNGDSVNELSIDPKSPDESPRGTPLHWAAFYGHVDVARFLIAKGAKVNAKTESGDCLIVQTPLDYAVGEGHAEMVKLLLESGSHVESSGHEFHWPLELALRMERLDIANILLKFGANINRVDFQEYTAFHRVIEKKKIKSVEYLLQNSRIDLNACSSAECVTPLHVAAYVGDISIIKLLLKKGADIYKKDKDGRTPFDIALEEGHEEASNLLKVR